MHVIGIDTGGTFTDTVVVSSDPDDVGGRATAGGLTDGGTLYSVGKSFSTPPDFEQGVIDSLTAAAAARGEDLTTLLTATDVVAHGTTMGLNGLLTRTGANVGLLVTEGFESTLPLAKANKLYGLPEEHVTNSLRWDKPDLLVPRRRIRGVRERVDVRGDVIVPLDEDHARAAIDALAADGVEAIGVSLLWSMVSPGHERRLRELVAERLPGVPVTLSSELTPRVGEYERTASVAVNAYVAPLVSGYLQRLHERLAAHGFGGELLVMTMAGGVLPLDAAIRAPIHTLQSGPAAGLARARNVGASLGHEHVITTDVGGTSFDVGLVVGGDLPLAARPMIERQALAVPVVDVVSIGTGGGSIAWYDDGLATLRVGPASAGSRPGPVCYGRGGIRPTVTDAAAVLGYIDQLGADLALDVEAATAALKRDVGDPLGLDARAAAAGVLDVAIAQMADLVRRTTVRRGHDPADFALYGFGGAAPQYVGRYAAELGVQAVVIPNLAAEFSAAGAATSDLRSRAEREVPACPLDDALPWLDGALTELADRAAGELAGCSQLTAAGVGDGAGRAVLTVERSIGLRFYRQLHAIEISVAAGPLDESSLATAASTFRSHYEQIAGRGTSSSDAPIELVSMSAVATIVRTVPGPAARPPGARPEPVRRRTAWFDADAAECPVYRWDDLGADATVAGPAFVESPQTTAVIFPGQSAHVDQTGNLRIAIDPATAGGSR